MGIALQSWERHGWRGSLPQVYWFWRDRKGLLGNPLSLLANFLFAYGVFTWLYARLAGLPWGLAKQTLHPKLLLATLDHPNHSNRAFGWVAWGVYTVPGLRWAYRCARSVRIGSIPWRR